MEQQPLSRGHTSTLLVNIASIVKFVSSQKFSSRGAVAEISNSLEALTMQSCNGRQAVMSALEALDLAGNRMNAFLVLFACPLLKYAV
jgi:hypothetical protein